MTQEEISYVDYIAHAQRIYEKGLFCIRESKKVLIESAKMLIIIAIADELRKQDELIQLDITETME